MIHEGCPPARTDLGHGRQHLAGWAARRAAQSIRGGALPMHPSNKSTPSPTDAERAVRGRRVSRRIAALAVGVLLLVTTAVTGDHGIAGRVALIGGFGALVFLWGAVDLYRVLRKPVQIEAAEGELEAP